MERPRDVALEDDPAAGLGVDVAVALDPHASVLYPQVDQAAHLGLRADLALVHAGVAGHGVPIGETACW